MTMIQGCKAHFGSVNQYNPIAKLTAGQEGEILSLATSLKLLPRVTLINIY